MPCNIGYREIARVTIPQPLPQEFKEQVKPPEIDQELLDKIGEEDPEFLGWLQDLDIIPLLQEALRRSIEKVGDPGKLSFSIMPSGFLEIRGKYMNDTAKKKLDALAKKVTDRFQIEVLGVVALLMDYEIKISEKVEGSETLLMIEGERHTHSGVNRYLQITKDGQGKGLIRFEHFSSPSELETEKRKFLALAQKLGINLETQTTEKGGQAIPQDAVHKHFLGEKV